MSNNVNPKNWQELIRPEKLQVTAGADGKRTAIVVAEPLEHNEADRAGGLGVVERDVELRAEHASAITERSGVATLDRLFHADAVVFGGSYRDGMPVVQRKAAREFLAPYAKASPKGFHECEIARAARRVMRRSRRASPRPARPTARRWPPRARTA